MLPAAQLPFSAFIALDAIQGMVSPIVRGPPTSGNTIKIIPKGVLRGPRPG